MVILIIAAVVIYLLEDGAFEGIIPGLPGTEDPADAIMTKYPTPEALEEGIAAGELDFDELPKDIRSMLTAFREKEQEVTAIPIP